MSLPDDPEALLAAISTWSPDSLSALRSGIDLLLAAPPAPPAPPVARPHVPGLTLRQEYVQCGKAGCTRCPHGPYWYAYWFENNRTRKRYLGKQLPADLSHVRPPA